MKHKLALHTRARLRNAFASRRFECDDAKSHGRTASWKQSVVQRFNTGGCNQCLPRGVKAERSLPWKKNEQAARSAFIPCEKTFRGIFPFIRHLSRSPEYTRHPPYQPIESREFNASRRYERQTFFSSFASFRIENSRFVRYARRRLARYKKRNRSFVAYSDT